MHNSSKKEIADIDKNLGQALYLAKNGKVLAEQLALDSTRLLSVTTDNYEINCNRGFMKRVWHNLSGQQTSIQQSKTDDLITMQKHSWRYLTHLQQQNCLQADSMIALRNNMLTLSLQEKQTKELVNKMGKVLLEKFRELSDRLSKVETTQGIHTWLLTLESRDYDERFSPRMRLLKILQDFFKLKMGEWSPDDLLMLQGAIQDVGLDRKEKLTTESFVYDLVGEIRNSDFDNYENLLVSEDVIPRNRILDEISSLSYFAVHHTAANYQKGSETVAILGDDISEERRNNAIHKIILGQLKNEGLLLNAEFKLGDLAIELLHCKRLAHSLGRKMKSPVDNIDDRVPVDTDKTTSSVDENSSERKSFELTKDEQLYVNKIKSYLGIGGVINKEEQRLLDKIKKDLCLTQERSKEIEMHFLFEFRDIISKNSKSPTQKNNENSKYNNFINKNHSAQTSHLKPLSVQEKVEKFFIDIGDKIPDLRVGYKIPDLYIGDKISIDKLENLRKCAGIPVNEVVIAIVDCTKLGTARDGLAFCYKGLYIHNGWTSTFKGNYFISWDQFISIEINKIARIVNIEKNKKSSVESILTDVISQPDNNDIFLHDKVAISMSRSYMPVLTMETIMKKLHNALTELS